jgi:hypothetical protein
MKTNAKLTKRRRTVEKVRYDLEMTRLEQLEESQRKVIRELAELDAVLVQRVGALEDAFRDFVKRQDTTRVSKSSPGRIAAIKDAIGNSAQAYTIANEVAEYTGKTYVALSTDQLRFLISRWEEDLESVLISALKHAAAIAELRQLVDNREGR